MGVDAGTGSLLAAMARAGVFRLAEAWHDARGRGPKWRARIDRAQTRAEVARAADHDLAPRRAICRKR